MAKDDFVRTPVPWMGFLIAGVSALSGLATVLLGDWMAWKEPLSLGALMLLIGGGCMGFVGVYEFRMLLRGRRSV